MEFLHARALGPRWRLLPFHAVTEAQGRVIAYEGLDILRLRLKPFLLRRERESVLDQLPQRTDNTFWTGMTVRQRRAYRQQAARLATLLSGRPTLQPSEVRMMLKSLTSMRVLCNSLAQFEWADHAERLREPTLPTPLELRALNSPKLEEFARVLEDLLDESRSKVVVFSQWERMLRLAHFAVREVLEARDLRAEVFHGGLTSRVRDDVLQAFREDPEVRVLFSTDAGGLGLNLQDAASIVVNLEVPWNPAVLEQRVGRVHRMGQRNSVQVLHFVTRGAIEERVRNVVESKRALFEGLFVDQSDQVVFDEQRRSSFVERVRSMITDSDGGPVLPAED
jgi:SNF2 family DNA or RNA helicase